jgi:LPXTG-motif cell wall-anchored protein
MIKMIFHSVLLFPVFFFSATVGHAQAGTTIKTTVDKNRILIGEPLQLTVEARIPGNAGIRFINIDSIGHFEFLRPPRIDTLNTDNGTTIKGIYTLTSFDSGHWVIPAFVLTPGVQTDTVPVDVVFADFDPNQDYHDIKDIIAVKPATKKQWWWYVVGGAILLLFIGIWLLSRKKKLPAIVPVIAVNAYEEAMKQLEKLQKEKPEAKQYHSQLVDIFRVYIFRKKGILSLQKTTDDLVIQVQSLSPDKKQFEQLAQALRLSDFVKFAKYAPSGKDDQDVYEAIKRSIDEIERMH